MDNAISLSGNVTKEPELRYSGAGTASSRFGVAVNRRWQDRQTKEWQEQVSFFNVVCFGQLAENVTESCAKGARVMVSGRLEQRSYEKDGEKKSVVEVIADDIAVSLKWATATVVKTTREGVKEAAPEYPG